MPFNSLLFLFQFLPVALLLYYVSPVRAQNPVLLLLSLVFYAWGGVSLSIILITAVIVNYFWGRFLQNQRGRSNARLWLITGIVINLLLLLYFKYLPFVAENLSKLGLIDFTQQSRFQKIVAPLGLSFLIFQSISYLVDVYHEKISAEKNMIKLSLYFVFFSKVISGPIVRYESISENLNQRKFNVSIFTTGIERFIIGLAKKVLIANTFAAVADAVFKIPVGEIGFFSAWLGAVSYFFQIYFDFSGYTDMAIGIAAMFGIQLPENFNYPYKARSIQDFWQRWHMSLSTWLRDYLFSPLSIGMRNMGKAGIAAALMLTFFLCGLWHGAGWNFILWGIYFGLFLSLEALGFSKFLKKLYIPLQSLYVIITVLFGWVIFKSDSLFFAKKYILTMLGTTNINAGFNKAFHMVNLEFIIVFCIALLGSAGLFKVVYEKSMLFLATKNRLKPLCQNAYYAVKLVFLTIVFGLSILYISSGSYNPFIYFRF